MYMSISCLYIFFFWSCILTLQLHSSKPSVSITQGRTPEPAWLGVNPGITIYNYMIVGGILNSLRLSFLFWKIRVIVMPVSQGFSMALACLPFNSPYFTGGSTFLHLPVAGGIYPKVPSVTNQKLCWEHCMCLAAALGSRDLRSSLPLLYRKLKFICITISSNQPWAHKWSVGFWLCGFPTWFFLSRCSWIFWNSLFQCLLLPLLK